MSNSDNNNIVSFYSVAIISFSGFVDRHPRYRGRVITCLRVASILRGGHRRRTRSAETSSSSQNATFVTDTDSCSSSRYCCCSNNNSGNYKIITETWNNGSLSVAELTECTFWPLGSSLPSFVMET